MNSLVRPSVYRPPSVTVGPNRWFPSTTACLRSKSKEGRLACSATAVAPTSTPDPNARGSRYAARSRYSRKPVSGVGLSSFKLLDRTAARANRLIDRFFPQKFRRPYSTKPRGTTSKIRSVTPVTGSVFGRRNTSRPPP